jgi:hypothetical protein
MELIGTGVVVLLIIVILFVMKHWVVFLSIALGVLFLAVAIAIAIAVARKKYLKTCQYTVVQEVELYREELNAAWEYPDTDDQWLFSETVRIRTGTEYNVLYVLKNGRYIEQRGLRQVPDKVWEMARGGVSYRETKTKLKHWFWGM